MNGGHLHLVRDGVIDFATIEAVMLALAESQRQAEAAGLDVVDAALATLDIHPTVPSRLADLFRVTFVDSGNVDRSDPADVAASLAATFVIGLEVGLRLRRAEA